MTEVVAAWLCCLPALQRPAAVPGPASPEQADQPASQSASQTNHPELVGGAGEKEEVIRSSHQF